MKAGRFLILEAFLTFFGNNDGADRRGPDLISLFLGVGIRIRPALADTSLDEDGVHSKTSSRVGFKVTENRMTFFTPTRRLTPGLTACNALSVNAHQGAGVRICLDLLFSSTLSLSHRVG